MGVFCFCLSFFFPMFHWCQSLGYHSCAFGFKVFGFLALSLLQFPWRILVSFDTSCFFGNGSNFSALSDSVDGLVPNCPNIKSLSTAEIHLEKIKTNNKSFILRKKKLNPPLRNKVKCLYLFIANLFFQLWWLACLIVSKNVFVWLNKQPKIKLHEWTKWQNTKKKGGCVVLLSIVCIKHKKHTNTRNTKIYP